MYGRRWKTASIRRPFWRRSRIGRDADGNATAWVVNPKNQVEQRSVVTDRVVGSNWLVTSGLRAGDRLIIEGTDKVKAGSRVNAVEVTAAKDKVQ